MRIVQTWSCFFFLWAGCSTPMTKIDSFVNSCKHALSEAETTLCSAATENKNGEITKGSVYFSAKVDKNREIFCKKTLSKDDLSHPETAHFPTKTELLSLIESEELKKSNLVCASKICNGPTCKTYGDISLVNRNWFFPWR